MIWLSRLRLRLRAIRHSDVIDNELSGEVAFHLAEQKAEYIAQGMSASDADAAARRLFGPVAAIEEDCREQRRTRWFEDFVQDTKFTLRSFAKSPGFTLVATLTLALGIGANTAFFSAAYAILFRPLPYPAPQRLIENDGGVAGIGPVIAEREISRTADYAGYLPNVDLNLQLSGEAWRVRAATATWNLSRVMGVAPARGRWFAASEEHAGQNRFAVLSDRMWRERFASDPAILGRHITLNEQPYEITGVMPPGFAFPSPETELWIPIRIDPANVGDMWGSGNLQPIGRLRDGMTVAAAQAELGPMIDRIRPMFPWRMPDLYGAGAQAVPHSEQIAKGVRPKLLALSAAALLLLLIACGNVANLLLARAVRREREFAMREALGARRSRLLRQLIAENLVLVAAGGLAGLLAATLILRALPWLLPRDTPRLDEINVDPSLIALAAATMLLTVILFSTAPLFRLWKLRRESLVGRAITASPRTSNLSLALIGVELALATVLLVGAGLMGRTLARLSQVDSGIHSNGVITAQVSGGPSRCKTIDNCEAWVRDLNRTLLALPGASSVNWSNAAPLGGEYSAFAAEVQDHPKSPSEPAYSIWQVAATPGYFRALGIPLRAGRAFTDADSAGSARVIIISESTAKRFWPRESALGKRIRPVWDREWRTVVGVSGDVAHYSLAGFPNWVDGAQYAPLAQLLPVGNASVQLTLLLGLAQPQSAANALTSALRERFPDVVVSRIRSLEGLRAESVADQRSTAGLLALLAGLGLLLGVAGVHGVISHRAAQRTREIGIRMSLGASAGSVVWMVVRETLLVASAGCAVGIAAAFVLSRFLASLLFGVTTHDTLAFALCPAALLIAALLAAAIPAGAPRKPTRR